MRTDTTTPIANRVIRDPALTALDKAVFAALSYMAYTSPEFLPSRCVTTIEEIADVLGVQVKGIQGALPRLQANGHIKWSANVLSGEFWKPGAQSWGYKIELIWN